VSLKPNTFAIPSRNCWRSRIEGPTLLAKADPVALVPRAPHLIPMKFSRCDWCEPTAELRQCHLILIVDPPQSLTLCPRHANELRVLAAQQGMTEERLRHATAKL
jgi:hypothetical protein